MRTVNVSNVAETTLVDLPIERVTSERCLDRQAEGRNWVVAKPPPSSFPRPHSFVHFTANVVDPRRRYGPNVMIRPTKATTFVQDHTLSRRGLVKLQTGRFIVGPSALTRHMHTTTSLTAAAVAVAVDSLRK